MDDYFGIDADGIENVNADCNATIDSAIYNLWGQRLNAVPAKGLFIVNGKKYCK